MKKKHFCLLLLLYLSSLFCSAQQADSISQSIQNLPDKYYARINKKMNTTNEQLTKKSLKYLTKFQKQEAKLQRKLQKLNPELEINKADERYKELSQKIKVKATPINKIVGGEYNGYLDSLGSSLSFLKQCNGITASVTDCNTRNSSCCKYCTKPN